MKMLSKIMIKQLESWRAMAYGKIQCPGAMMLTCLSKMYFNIKSNDRVLDEIYNDEILSIDESLTEKKYYLKKYSAKYKEEFLEVLPFFVGYFKLLEKKPQNLRWMHYLAKKIQYSKSLNYSSKPICLPWILLSSFEHTYKDIQAKLLSSPRFANYSHITLHRSVRKYEEYEEQEEHQEQVQSIDLSLDILNSWSTSDAPYLPGENIILKKDIPLKNIIYFSLGGESHHEPHEYIVVNRSNDRRMTFSKDEISLEYQEFSGLPNKKVTEFVLEKNRIKFSNGKIIKLDFI